MTKRTDGRHPKNILRVVSVTRGEWVTDAESEEARAQVRAALQRGREREKRREALWGPGGREAMTRLCKALPALRRAAGVDPWDSTLFLSWACAGVSSGELQVAAFVLGVWHASVDWDQVAHEEGLLEDDEHFPRFDFFAAVGNWDEGNRATLLLWAHDPFWP